MKKTFKTRLLLLSVVLLTLVLTLTSCAKKYTITFVVDGQTYDTQIVKKGQCAKQIDEPEKENQYLDAWYEGDIEFDFTKKITSDHTLVAKYLCTEHDYTDPTCTTLATCKICGQTMGEVLDHYYLNACDATCQNCGYTRDVAGHDFDEATHTKPKTCKICGTTEGEKIPYVTSVTITNKKYSIIVDEQIKFTSSVLPTNAISDVTWSIRKVGDADATISEDGTFTAISAGIVYVYCTSDDVTNIFDSIEITIIHPLVDYDKYDAFNIMTGLGTDASTEIEINYHTHNTKTSVEYTLATDVDFNNPTTVTGDGVYFTNGSEKCDVPFLPRNVYRVSLKGLTPNTDYIYRINKGDNTYSEIYKFSTAPQDGSDTAFFMMADTHYHAIKKDGEVISHGSEISEKIIEHALNINPNIKFITTAGDIVDTGGNADTWSMFFKHSTSLKMMPRLGVGGNHEYYFTGTGQCDNKYIVAHHANPKNGPSCQLGDSCYFIYNDILYIILDNEKYVNRVEVIKWLEEVLKNNDATYTFVMMHTPVYYEENETSNKDRDEELLGLFEKYSVDLVVSGHYHGDRYRPDYYQGKDSTDPGLGVNYITLTFSGVKSMSGGNLPKGYLVETHEGTIKITCVDSDGNIYKIRTLTTKRHKEVTKDTKENLLASVNGVYNEDEKTYTINVSNNFYGNVKEMNVVEKIRGEINSNMVFPTSSYNKLVIKNIKPFYEYDFDVEIIFEDGTKEVKNFKLDLSKDINLQADNIQNDSVHLTFAASDSSLDWIIKEYEVYVDGIYHSTFSYIGDFDPVTEYLVTGIDTTKGCNIKLVAKTYKGKVVFEKSIDVKKEN